MVTVKITIDFGEFTPFPSLISQTIVADLELSLSCSALLRQASEQKVLFVFVVIDSLHQRTNDASGTTTPTTPAPSASDINQQSILAMKTVQYETGPDGRLALKLNRYIDS